MIRKLRRKFIAVAMGVAAFLLLAVFLVLVVSTESGMQRQSAEVLRMALNGELHKGRNQDTQPAPEEVLPTESGPAEAILPPEEPEHSGGKSGWTRKSGQEGWGGRFPCFTAAVSTDGSVVLEDRAAVLLSDYDIKEIEELARSTAAASADTGTLSSYRLRYAKKALESGTLVAFADTSVEYNALSELVKNSLVIGAATLLLLFAASVLLARWAVRPVENAWNQQKQFVGDASHELKTPLTVILSNADMILDHPGEDGKRWTQNIKAEAVRMKRLTEELLSLARSDDTERRMVPEMVDLSYLVTDSVLSFEPAVFESGHTLSYEVADRIHVSGDPAALSQLLAVLLENAVKYASEGGAVAVRLDADGRYARLTVSNTGEPIPPEDLTRIFERFYRSDPSRHGDGHGLGLSIARSITQQHRGKIWAESSGTLNTFTVLLPYQRGAKP